MSLERRRLRDAARWGAAALGAWSTAALLMFFAGVGGFERHDVESAYLWFAAAALLYRFLDRERDGRGATRAPSAIDLLVCIVASVILYRPAIGIGALSDDYVLLERAMRFDVWSRDFPLFRPVSFLMFGAAARTVGLSGLHVLLALIHGLNAWLVSVLVHRLIADRLAARLAALLALTSPLAPEAVAWISGGCDVVATAFMLGATICLVDYNERASIARRLAFVACGVAAFLSKETAVAVPIVAVLFAAAGSQRVSRAQLVDASGVLVVAAAFVLWRLASVPAGVLTRTSDWYFVKERLFRPFESLGFPWHVAFVRAHRGLASGATVLLAVWLVTALLKRAPNRSATRVAVAAALAVGTSIVPLLAYFFVSPTLEGSRYAYFASCAWATLLAAAAIESRRSVAIAAISVFAIVSTLAVRDDLGYWRAAAALRDRVEQSASDSLRRPDCRFVSMRDLPDAVDGAYVFRNGVQEAFAHDLGIATADPSRAGDRCSFEWTGSAFAPVGTRP